MKIHSWLRGAALGAVVWGGSGSGVSSADGEARPPPVLVAQVGHSGTLTSVCMSADGRWVLTGGYDYTARLWDRDSGREVRRFDAARSVVTSVAFSPDASWLVTGHFDKAAHLWDRKSGRELRTCAGHGAAVTSVAVSSDGRYVLTGSEDRSVRLFESETGKEVRRYEGSGGKVSAVALSADGRWVLAGGEDKAAHLWERDTGREAKRYDGHTDRVSAVAFSPDARWVLTGSHDKTARLWDRETGTEARRYTGHGDRVTGVACSADGRWVVTGSWDKQARAWDRESGKQVGTFAGHADFVSAVALSADGRWVLTGSTDMGARLWDRESGKEIVRYEGRAAKVTAVACTGDGRWILTGSADGSARLWDRESGAEERRFAGHTKGITSVALSADGRWALTGSEDKSAQLWDRDSGQPVRRFDGHTDRVASVALSADGRLVLTGSDDRTARLWEAATGRELRRYEGHTDRVSSVALSADGRWVVTGSHDKTARVWERDSGRNVRVYAGHTSMVSAVALSGDARWLVTGSYDKSARLWEREAGTQVRVFEGHTSWIVAVAVTANGAGVVTGSYDGTARRWDAATGKELGRFLGHGGWVTSLALTADGRTLHTGSMDSTVRLWELESGRALCSLLSFRDGSWAAVDPQGRFDASREGRVDGLHWVVGDDVIALDQLMSAYYEPGLLTKAARPPGAPAVARLQVKDISKLPLNPSVAPSLGADGLLRIELVDHGGGLGKVVVKVDGATVAEQLPVAAPGPGGRASVSVPLAGLPSVAAGRTNHITVEAYNAEGSLRSRGAELDYPAPGKDTAAPPAFWAVVVGVSDYAGAGIRLRYSAKDAQDFADALTAAAAGLFGPENIHATVLTTIPPRAPPTRANLVTALAEVAQKAAADDVFVLYLSGHGVTHGTPPDSDYYYLTQEATVLNVDAEADRKERAFSALELQQALKGIKARKKILVFDTCRAGQAAADLTGRGDDAGDQTRVMARVRQAMGTYILAGCAADRSSFEASRFAQGLLTYALLEGIKRGVAGVVRNADLIEAGGLLQYALRRVPEIAQGIGGIQDPQITVPDHATPIDLGRITARVRESIHLGGEILLFTRADFQLSGDVPGDPQGLASAVHTVLTAASEGRGGPALSYVPGSEGPGMLRLAGRYTVAADKISLRVYVTRIAERTPEALGQFDITGAASAVPDLASRLVAQAMGLVKPR